MFYTFINELLILIGILIFKRKYDIELYCLLILTSAIYINKISIWNPIIY